MSYETLGAVPTTRAQLLQRGFPPAGHRGSGIRRERFHPPSPSAAYLHRREPGRERAVRVIPGTYPLAMPAPVSEYSELGFSLKPPKWARKIGTTIKKAVTIKNVLKVGAVVGAAALIPGALPLVAKGAVGAAKLIGSGGLLAAKGTFGTVKLLAKGGALLPSLLVSQLASRGKQTVAAAVEPTVSAVLAPEAQPTPAPSPSPMEVMPSSSYYGGGGGGYATAPMAVEAEAQPAAAGIGGALLPVAIGVGLLVAMAATRKRGSR